MVNETRIWKLNYEIKDLIFVAFQQKLNPEHLQSLHGLVMGWVLEYSALQYDFISGNVPEDPTLPMP
jgi:hypothetical protein